MLTAIILSILCALGDIGFMFMSQRSFGHIPTGERLERIKKSPNYDGKKFVNEVQTNVMTQQSSKFETWKNYLTSDKSLVKPDTALKVIKTDVKSLPQDKDWLVWFGHSSYLINLSGKKFLIDPVFYKGSPVSFVNKAFKGTEVYKPSDMPDIDYLVISHDHWDHLDYETVSELKPRIKKIICGLGVGEHFEYWGFDKQKLVEHDWWEDEILEEGFKATTTPARHFSGRSLQQNKTLWASYVIETPKRTVWVGGDTGYGPHFKKIGEKFTNIDLAILENGQYNIDWAEIHTMPEYLGKEMVDLDAKRYLTVHHSKFALSTHSYTEPLENAKKASEESQKPVFMPQMGEVLYLE